MINDATLSSLVLRATHLRCNSGTGQPQTITAIKGLPLLGCNSCRKVWMTQLKKGVHQHLCIHLTGLVSILKQGEDFEEISAGENLEEEDSFQMRSRKL